MAKKLQPDDIPERFRVSKHVLMADRFMTHFIKIGGAGIILAVFGIFFFILVQIVPLFKGAHVEKRTAVLLPQDDYRIMGVDEWGSLPFLVNARGEIFFIDLLGKRGFMKAELEPQAEISALSYQPKTRQVAFATDDGHYRIVRIQYSSSITDDEQHKTIVKESVNMQPFAPIGAQNAAISMIAHGGDDDNHLIAVVQTVNGAPVLTAQLETQQRGLLGNVGEAARVNVDLSAMIKDAPTLLAVNAEGDRLLVADAAGLVTCFSRNGETMTKDQVFKPFASSGQNPKITGMNFLLGGVTVIFSASNGTQAGYAMAVKASGTGREFLPTKTFPKMDAPIDGVAISLRNKAFLTHAGNQISLRYSTTQAVRWSATQEKPVKLATLNSKYDRLFTLDAAHELTTYGIDDRHPEAGFKAFFGKIWYEGSASPKYEWQSTGGSDDFEPKLSLVPLIIGTFKGTFYAILFSVPIALLAALYTSQFLPREIKAVIKPMMEIMASLPSVVLGFLSALWLAPILESRVPSLLLVTFLIPSTALAMGWAWAVLPVRWRVWVKPGREVFVLLPVLLLVAWAGWHAGPWIEKLFFVVSDPASGTSVADFRLWWPTVTGLPFEQRNSLVVGFMMGFAVIPIIYTISEDALSNVPPSLTSASLALGASRWQTAVRVVLPTASAGIFSAIMIGLGRAIGETMIVVMATGNTPIMNFNIFSGMRTLSANIAVELPEAPVHGTLYRSLFLGALVLFLMTFALNTVAEVLRQHLREKYKTV